LLLAIVLDEEKNKEIIDYINSFTKDNELLDYNKIVIDLINKGITNNIVGDVKENVEESILLQVNDKVKDIISEQMQQFKEENISLLKQSSLKENILNNEQLKNNNVNQALVSAVEKITDTLDAITEKLNNTEIVTKVVNTSIDNTNIVEEVQESEYQKHLNENKKEPIIADVDINPLLANILSNANR
jgi:hypothetical protein